MSKGNSEFVGVDLGPVLICPQCKSACRQGSRYFVGNLGKCHRCRVPMTEDIDLARVKRRTLYVIEDFS